MNWRRFDTLFLRLFVLMWVTLVLSHGVAFLAVGPMAGPRGPAPQGGHPGAAQWPTLPSLPPGNPFTADEVERGGRPPAGGPPGAGGPTGSLALPRGALWADYALRMIVIALGAALGARWLASPMRRLSRAAGELSRGFGRGKAAPVLDVTRGTREVREAAQVFNGMATRLQEQFDARGLHMAALSHDLRTPLTRLRLRLEQLPDAAAQSAANDVREMDEMIDMTLAVLREQRDAQPSAPVDMASLLQAVADDLAEQGHDVVLAGDAGAMRARAHPAAVRRVVGNLVGNALRYGERARIGLARSGNMVEVTVDDDGPGIPADRLEQVFEPWVRLTGTHERAGHGLGLAIARDLAERDGGRLTLANRPAGGLRATLHLPAA